MAPGLPSDEVAEDYKNSLEDLAMNSRYEISNLTVIAKENTEHALAISRVLENHILTAPPARKLPALYVLDSIVKNVGTPYTLFLGRNLFNTFMKAYTQVNSEIRRKLDEMLKTWKEPVPGSLDPRPVFSPDVTRPIETALIKARTQALQSQQKLEAKSRPVDLRGRTSTPPTNWYTGGPIPNGRPGSAQFPSSNQQRPYPVNGNVPQYEQQQSYPSQYPLHPTPQSYQQPYPPTPAQYHQPRGSVNVDDLNRDVAAHIAGARLEFAANPYDEAIQRKLKALLDLQTILQSQQLPQDQLELIRVEIAKLAPSNTPARPTPPPVLATPPILPNPATPVSIQNALQQPQVAALLQSTNLAEILKQSAARPTATPPQSGLPFPLPVVNTPPPATAVAAPPPAPARAENTLLASLRAVGLLPPVGGTLPIPAMPSLPTGTGRLSIPKLKSDVQMTAASLKIPRPYLLPSLYEVKSNQCSTCGRRFFPTTEGKDKKARHLDWHFKTNQRMQEALRRGQNRSWFLDEREWIKSREMLDGEDLGGDNETSSLLTADAAKKPKTKWIIAPNDPVTRNIPCPICQEKFESTWSEEIQDWVWNDAIQLGGRIFHASCHDEATKDGGATPARGKSSTPDSVLGKRKAEESDLNGSRSKIKTEPVSA